MTAVLTRSAPVGGVAVSGAASTAIRGLVEGPRRGPSVAAVHMNGSMGTPGQNFRLTCSMDASSWGFRGDGAAVGFASRSCSCNQRSAVGTGTRTSCPPHAAVLGCLAVRR